MQWKTQNDGYVYMQRVGKYVVWTMSPSMKVQGDILSSLESAK
jgi:hypothetical protein